MNKEIERKILFNEFRLVAANQHWGPNSIPSLAPYAHAEHDDKYYNAFRSFRLHFYIAYENYKSIG